MAQYQDKKSSGLWVWIVIGIIVATIAVATLYYIGWFDNNTHVDLSLIHISEPPRPY